MESRLAQSSMVIGTLNSWAISLPNSTNCTELSPASRKLLFKSNAVPDGVLDFSVAAVIGLQFQGIPLPVGDECVIAVAGEQRQLGAGCGPHPPDNEPHRGGTSLTLERSAFSLGHVGSVLHPVGDGRPLRLGVSFVLGS